ncbi:MAG: hypothetical protein J0M24_09395 [Verrucomicrobia bacterium]|nr:hypothetical protein [Verrucomicrobiota bacterium]
MDPQDRQAVIDDEHLKLLSLGYLVSGGFTAVFSLFGLFYAGMGLFMLAVTMTQKSSSAPPVAVALLFGTMGLLFLAIFIVVTLCKFRVASCLKQRRGRTFCLIVAGLTAIAFPYGTMLSVFTFLVLCRPSVVQQFNAPSAPTASVGPSV